MSSPTQTPQTPPPPVPPRYYIRRRSIAGPIVLIALGVLFLLGNMHVITWPRLAFYWARYWPVLIILWGVIKLYEHWSDTRQGLPGRGIGAGGVLLLIFLIIFGLSATAAYRVNWNAFSNNMDFDSDFGGLFGNTYNFEQTLQQPFPPGKSLRVVDDRGEVTVNTWDEPNIKVVVNKRVIANNDNDSKDVDNKTQAVLNSGEPLVLDANTHGAGNHPVESNLQIWMPRNAAVEIDSGRGDITVATRDGNVQATTNHGDVTVQAVTGNVTLTLRGGSVRVQNVKGDVAVNGRISDTTVSDVNGSLTFSGDFFGEMDLARIAKGVSFHSSRTDLDLAALPGDLTMQSGDLRARTVIGPMRVMTRSKDIHLENVTGDLKIENSNGLVEYHAGSKLGPIDISNSRGDVQLTLPEQASFQLDARTRRGDIDSDFGNLNTSGQGQEKVASAVIGHGGPVIRVNNVNGDISFRKGSPATAAESETAPQPSLPPDQTIVPGGGVESTKPPKPPRRPRPPARDMSDLRWHAGPHELYFGPSVSM